MKTILFALYGLWSTLVAQDIEGFWKTIDRKTGQAQCVIAVYSHEGICYGRIIGSYGDDGKMDDTLYAPKGRAPGIEGEPYYSGLDILWGLKNKGDRYRGKIVDPKRGNVYKAEVWRKGDNLIVRGELLFFGRNETWLPALESDFPADFKKPDVSQFVPIVPQVK